MAHEQPSPPTFQTPEKAAIPRGELAYRQIRDAIQSGHLTPGTRMREVEVAQWLGTSRTPVREALGRLLNDGLVANDPNRGMIVTELDHQMVDELYVMREVLEGTAAGLAARNATESEIALLRRLAEKDRTIGNNPAELSGNNKSFHDTLYQSAHNRYLLKTLSTLRESMALLGHTTLALPGRSSTAINEHDEIVSAIEKRDAAAAEAAARSHIRAAYRARMQVLFEEKA